MRINIILDKISRRVFKDILNYQTKDSDEATHISFELKDKDKINIENDTITIYIT